MRVARAVDLWLGELARAGRADGTRDAYRRHLEKFIDQLERTRPDVVVREVTTNDCRTFLDGWIRVSVRTGRPIAPAPRPNLSLRLATVSRSWTKQATGWNFSWNPISFLPPNFPPSKTNANNFLPF